MSSGVQLNVSSRPRRRANTSSTQSHPARVPARSVGAGGVPGGQAAAADTQAQKRVVSKARRPQQQSEEEDAEDDEDLPQVQQQLGGANLGSAAPGSTAGRARDTARGEGKDAAQIAWDQEVASHLAADKDHPEVFTLTIQHAANLKNLETLSTSDPYVKVTSCTQLCSEAGGWQAILNNPDGGKQEVRTRELDGQLDPVWGESFDFTSNKAMWGGYKGYAAELLLEVLLMMFG